MHVVANDPSITTLLLQIAVGRQLNHYTANAVVLIILIAGKALLYV